MSDEEFISNEEVEKRIRDHYDNISKLISKQIRELDEEERLPYLKAAEPSDASLLNLYIQAKKNQDYETCLAARALLVERGCSIPKA